MARTQKTEPKQDAASVAKLSRIVGHKTVALDAIDAFRFGNPRKMRARMTEVLNNSLKEFGYVEPIIVREVNGRYEILNGHHRFMGMKQAGASEMEVTIVDCSDDNKARALALALNRISADWDKDSLDEYVGGIISEINDPRWISDVTGFSGAEVELLASVNTNFLNELVTGVSDEPPARSTVMPVAPQLQRAAEREHFSIYVSIKQQKIVDAAVAKAKSQASGPYTTADALTTICSSYLENT
jgi:hypothetical protein